MTSGATPLGLGVLASGRGSNLQAILDACARPGFPARVVVVISDRERAQALERARAAGVEARFINPKDFADREAFDLALVREFTARQVGLVCSAGFMRILSPVFVRAFAGRVVGVHPALLPAFPGLHAQRQALAYGVRVAGATVHFVDEGVDSGPVILQRAIELPDAADADAVHDLLRPLEHELLPEAIRLIARGAVSFDPANPRRVVISD